MYCYCGSADLVSIVPIQYREEISQRTKNERNIEQLFEKSPKLLADVRNREQAWKAEKQRQEVWSKGYQKQMLQLVNRSS